MHQPLRELVQGVTRVIDRSSDEETIVAAVKSSMRKLVAENGWLPEEFTRCTGPSYSQHLLYCDPLERFSVVSFVWRPQQCTPVHDHTVWGVIGQLVGEEVSQSYDRLPSGKIVAHGPPEVLRKGEVTTVSPSEIDIHVVQNASRDETAISIHTYGANIGRVHRNTYDLATGERTMFVSSYSNSVLPNIW
jgi:predicted metal-dependent enzyme (double-stranded beta helix superfamily)